MNLFGMSKKRSASVKKSSDSDFNAQAVEELYAQLRDEDDPEVISMEGIGKLCEMLGMDASSDVRALVLAWRLGAVAKPGQIARQEFVGAMRSMGLSDAAGLRGALPGLDPGFLERSDFREFYRFVFQFSREGTHKTLEKDLVIALLPIVLDINRTPHLPLFLDYLQQCSHQRITLDQWDSFLQFNQNIKADLSNWEDDGAWPLLLDEYVDWRRTKASK